MDEFVSDTETVDAEVRAYVYSLVSALGGTGADEEGRYILGDDALACLKDIKRWLKLYDEKTNRLDVARCLAEANVVKGDLLEILVAWPEDATEDKIKFKIALACLELLVPLTWPLEKDELQTTVNHHRHIPYLRIAQISYKRDILEHDSSSILRTAMRIGIPSITLPLGERGPRDEGIIKLLLYFFRNVVMISAPGNLPVEWNEDEVSRSATIEAFHKQDVFALLLTIASNMGEDFNTQDTVLLEILFHLVKGVESEKLFMNETQLQTRKTHELQGLLSKEAAMLRGYSKNAPTRHNRFGTMIWVKRDDERVSCVSGQDVLSNSQYTLSKMDQTKKWNRPKHRGRDAEIKNENFNLPVCLTPSALQHLRGFVEDFLDSGFNLLFSHVRKAIEREADRILEVHSQQFFFLISWFLEAERIRRKSQEELRRQSIINVDNVHKPDSFSLVASVLSQETFIMLNRFMQERLDLKQWNEVDAGMRCFTQILLTVQEMAQSSLEEDQEIAENIQNRIFYEETTHDRIVTILRGFKYQGFGYLDACTELSHVFLRMLERYSKENVDLQIRSRRRVRKRKSQMQQDPESHPANQDSEEEEVAEAQRTMKERKFDFNRFSSKFLTQGCIDTFVSFARFYKELSVEQLKRAHRFFYRVAFKQEMSVMLFRLDIIALFNRMVKGTDGLDNANPMFREWDELIRQLTRRLTKTMQQRPQLAVELLFSKISSTVFYLQYGYEKQTIKSKPRAPADLEIKGAMTREEQIGVAVAVLHEEKLDSIDFVRSTLASAASERLSWEAEATARESLNEENGDAEHCSTQPSKAPSIVVKPDSDERWMAMFKDSKLRLLMTLVGFERLGIDDEADASWIVPSTSTAEELQHMHYVVDKHRNEPVMQYGDDDPISAEDMLRRKVQRTHRRAEFDDDSDPGGSLSEDKDDFLFPAGGPTNRKSEALAELKAKRRRRRVDSSGGEDDLDDAVIAARRKARLLADLERRRRIKSKEFVTGSDDEEDEERDREFFEQEEQRRKVQSEKVAKALLTARIEVDHTLKTKKRKSQNEESQKHKKARHNEHDADSETDDHRLVEDSSSPQEGLDSDISENEASDTPLSSPHDSSSKLVQVKQTIETLKADNETARNQVADTITKVNLSDISDDDEDYDQDISLPMTSRRRTRIAVVGSDED